VGYAAAAAAPEADTAPGAAAGATPLMKAVLQELKVQ
jgi:hypothetical protein